MTPLIRRLQSTLQGYTSGPWHSYTVPGLWVGANEPVTFPSAAAYLLHQLSVVDQLERRRRHTSWNISKALAYNCSVRHVTSYDHGKGVKGDGWRTTGTFLKLIGLLPYLDSLGVNTIVLMPVTEIGVVGRKGTLGSPYAVKHPLHLDPNLAEPVVPMSIEDQARVLVEACHALGMKVILETVLRTASIDSDLVEHHPEWFYWVDSDRLSENNATFSAPSFSDEQLSVMKEKVDSGTFAELPEPTDEYQELFARQPFKVQREADGWHGLGPKKRRLNIPGAFADWPADDPQPAWSDVTYLRLHDHPHYRYMAYNTVRMYERSLDTDEYRAFPLWNTIAAIIPYYVRSLNIDGAMIDMGHALPRSLRKRVINEAKASKPGFILLEENFKIEQESAYSGYDAAIGYLPFDAHDLERLERFINRVARREIPIRFFATPESHNTPRALMRMDNPSVVAHTWLLLQLLPNSFGFIHSGIELAERTPVNTGLQFTEEELQQWSAEKLPLFSDVPLNWDAGVETSRLFRLLYSTMKRTATFREMSPDDTIDVLEGVEGALGFWRHVAGTRNGLLVVHGTSNESTELTIPLPKAISFVAPQEGVDLQDDVVLVTVEPRQTRCIPFLAASTSGAPS